MILIANIARASRDDGHSKCKSIQKTHPLECCLYLRHMPRNWPCTPRNIGSIVQQLSLAGKSGRTDYRTSTSTKLAWRLTNVPYRQTSFGRWSLRGIAVRRRSHAGYGGTRIDRSDKD